MTHEIERILPAHIPVESYVASGDRPVRISPEAIERSKSLALLEQMLAASLPDTGTERRQSS